MRCAWRAGSGFRCRAARLTSVFDWSLRAATPYAYANPRERCCTRINLAWHLFRAQVRSGALGIEENRGIIRDSACALTPDRAQAVRVGMVSREAPSAQPCQLPHDVDCPPEPAPRPAEVSPTSANQGSASDCSKCVALHGYWVLHPMSCWNAGPSADPEGRALRCGGLSALAQRSGCCP
jgi:hypothetical protein